MKKQLALLLTAALALSMTFAGCGSKPTGTPAGGDAQQTTDNTGSATGGQGYKIALCNNSLNETWRVQMIAEFEQACDELKAQGVITEYIETNADADASKQVSDMEDLIAKGVDGILIAPQNEKALNDVISEAMGQGIKVVVYNSAVSSDFEDYTSYVYQDNYDFGRINGQFLADALGGKGKIIVLQGVAGNSISADRWQGAKDVFDQYPDIEVLAEANGNWDYADGKAATEALLSAYPEIDGVWSQGGAMTQGAIDAFLAAGRPLVPMSGESGNGFMAQWKELQGVDNFSSCAPIYDPAMVVDALNVLIDALDGKEVEHSIKLPMGEVTVDTLDDYYRPDLPDTMWAGLRLTPENEKKLFGGTN